MNIKEILVLHHSHLDVGYTHTQPIVWELQYEFIEQALKLLDKTKDLDELSQPRWTCEVTAQVMKWLEYASEESKNKFLDYIKENRIGISGLEYNTTPNCNAEQLTLQLHNIKLLKEIFGIEIKTVIQHDVNGIPWSASDIFLDAGIELLIMGTNNHFGGYTHKRPSAFRWRTPSGRELFVMNGAHYTMFDQLLDTPANNIAKMEEGYNKYLEHLEKIEYNLDFIYLTTANAPVCYDNAPPNFEVAELIKKWNEKGNEPKIRYITPNMLLERIRKLDQSKLDKLNGDWTDYWNFGCSSTAYETKLNQNTKSLLFTAEMISTSNLKGNVYRNDNVLKKSRAGINLYDEHTWGAFNSVEYHNSFVKAQDNLKKQPAYEARELTEYYLINELENLAGNPETNYKQEGILVVNPTPAKRNIFIPVPDWWQLEGKRLRTARLSWANRYRQMELAKLFGPVEMEPFSWQKIPFNKLKPAEETKLVSSGDDIEKRDVQRLNRAEGETEERGFSFIESPHHRLEYDKHSGRIFSLLDKNLDWEVLDRSSSYTFFQFVRESPDPLFEGERFAMYARNLELEKFDVNCWLTEWKVKYETASELLECRTEHSPVGISLILKFRIPGAKFLEQRITLQGNSPLILLDVTLHKEEVLTPESIYFAFPINLEAAWKAHYDSAGVHIELDEEQLPRSSKGWQTVESYASMYNKDKGAALFCPDAPMVQLGDFNFGRKYLSIERKKNPLMLAWSLNNYWDTNFSAAQPGIINFSYAFTTFENFEKNKMFEFGKEVSMPVEVHPAMSCPELQKGSFIKLDDENVQLLNLKVSEDKKGIIARLVKNVEQPGTTKITFSQNVKQAHLVNTFEEPVEELKVNKNEVLIELIQNRITQLFMIPE